MKVLITGCDGSLGSTLMATMKRSGEEIYGIQKCTFDNESDLDEPAYIVDQIIKDLPDIDILVNSHGINKLAWIGKDKIDYDLYNIMHHNVNGMYMVVDSIKRHQSSPCRVINIASVTHRISQRTTSLYCASKAAVVHMTKVMARELAPHGWIVNCLAPGKMIDTEMADKTDAQVRNLRGWNQSSADDYALGMIPMGRFTNTAEVTDAIVKILELPDYINGACIDMTGGI